MKIRVNLTIVDYKNIFHWSCKPQHDEAAMF